MDILALVREFGLPFALLLAAVGALWRAWGLERRWRERENKNLVERLARRELELYSLYRKLALRDLGTLVRKRNSRGSDGKRQNP